MILESVECPAGSGGIYYIQSSTGLIKIGKSKNIPQRFAGLNTQSCVPLRLVAYEECDNMDEREVELHAQFGALNVRYEWFAPTDLLRAHVQRVAENRPEIAEPDLPPPADQLILLPPPAPAKSKPENVKGEYKRFAVWRKIAGDRWECITIEDEGVPAHMSMTPRLARIAARKAYGTDEDVVVSSDDKHAYHLHPNSETKLNYFWDYEYQSMRLHKRKEAA